MFGVDLLVKFELDVIIGLFAVRVAGEGQAGGLKVELHRRFGHVRHRDGEVDDVLLRGGLGGALRP